MPMWSCESLACQGMTAAGGVEHCTTVRVSDVILPHISAEGVESAAPPDSIAGLRAQGFRFVVVEEMLGPSWTRSCSCRC